MTAEAARQMPRLPALSGIKNIHIIGICGTAMGTLAAMLKDRGFRVRGSDAGAYPPMSDWLAAREIGIQAGYAAEHIAADTDLVVVGNVCRRDNPEAVAVAARELPSISLPEALRWLFFADRQGLVITGTHGKTTTTSMVAWMLYQAQRDPSFFVGGVTTNFGSNYRLGEGDTFIIEGDEYDTAFFDKVPKFWHYPAFAATINNVEYDHADIYPNIEEIEHVFSRFAAQVDPAGVLWVNGDDARALGCASHAAARVRTFGLGVNNELYAMVLKVDGEGTHLRVFLDGAEVGETVLPMIGHHNTRNYLGAVGLVMAAGLSAADALRHIAGFAGVKKRQELKGEVGGVLVIDDFAHHPSALRETLAALRARYGARRLWAIFEAKSNTSRRAVFQQDYPKAFVDADIVVLSQPWKQDTLPESEKISIPQMVEDIRALGKEVHLIPNVEEIVTFVARESRPGDVIAGLSGSAFGGLHDRLLEAFRATAEP